MRPNGSPDQAVDVPFTGGMGEGVAPFVLNVPFVELAEDCVITKEGAYRRLPGGSSPAALTGVPNGSRGLSVFDGTIVQHTTNGPQQYNESSTTWRASNPRGFVPTQVRTDPVITQPFSSIYNLSLAVSSGGFELYVWDEQLPGEEQSFGRTWTAKRMAIRDPQGGWVLAPTLVGGPTNAGHQVIAIGAYFYLAYSTTSGFQVSRFLQSATSYASRADIVVNAQGASATYNAKLYGSVHDCTLSTDGTRAYFVVSPVNSTTFYIHTVNFSGLVGGYSFGTGDAYANYAIAVNDNKVYVGYTPTSGGVTLHNVTEAGVTGSAFTTALGNFALASGKRGFRLRMLGLGSDGVAVAVEGATKDITSNLTLFTTPGTVYPYYKQLPSFAYTEFGVLPSTDVVASYTALANRAYAHNYCLNSGFYRPANRGAQIGICWNDFAATGASDAGNRRTDREPPAGPGGGGTSVAEYAGYVEEVFYGALWVELISQVTPTQQGNPSPKLRLRTLARYGWDKAISTLKFTPADTGAIPVGDYVETNFAVNALSRVVDGKFGFSSLADTDTATLSVAAASRCIVDTSPKPPLSVLCGEALFFDGCSQDFWDGIHSFENTPHFPPAVAWLPRTETTGDPSLAFGAISVPAFVGPNSSRRKMDVGFTDLYKFYWEFTDAKNVLHRSAITTLRIERVAAIGDGLDPEEYTGSIPGRFVVLPPVSSNGADFGNLRLCVGLETGFTSLGLTPGVFAKYTTDWEFFYGEAVNLLTTSSTRISCGPTERSYGAGLPTSYGNTNLPTQISVYTDGGILQAEASPSPVSITATRDRLWAISADDRRTLYYTKPLETGIAPEFNGALTIRLPADAGEGVVMLTVDDKPVVLCERGIYAIVGDGPNALGLQGEFLPQVIQSDTGCADKNSTAKCDYGAFFQGERGIYLLDRGLNVSLISQGVQDRAQQDISKAIAVPKEQQVRFGLTNGGILVYHYALKAWTYLDKTAYDAVVWDDSYARVFDVAAFDVAVSDGSSPADPEGTNTMRIKTSWIKADKMQGFARFKRVLLLHSQQGVVPTSYGPITVNVYFNYEEDPEGGSYVETSTISSANRKPVAVRSQVDVRIGRQKVESIKLDIICPNYFQQGDFTEFYDPISLEGVCLVVGTITNTQFRHLRKQTKS